MLFNKYLTEEEKLAEELDDVDMVGGAIEDIDSPEAMEVMAREVETHMTAAALEAVSYFEGGEEAVRNFTESAEVKVLVESRRLPKKTFVRLNRDDDLQRRNHLACLVLAKNKKDPLWNKLALNRVKEKQLRNAIYKKYGTKAAVVARKSQQVHVRQAKSLPSLPKIQF